MKQGVPKLRAVRASGVLAPTMGYFLGWAVLIDLFDIAFPSEVLVLVMFLSTIPLVLLMGSIHIVWTRLYLDGKTKSSPSQRNLTQISLTISTVLIVSLLFGLQQYLESMVQQAKVEIEQLLEEDVEQNETQVFLDNFERVWLGAVRKLFTTEYDQGTEISRQLMAKRFEAFGLAISDQTLSAEEISDLAIMFSPKANTDQTYPQENTETTLP